MKTYANNILRSRSFKDVPSSVTGGGRSKYNISPEKPSLLNHNHPVSTGSLKSLFTPSVLCLATMAAVLLAPDVAMATDYYFSRIDSTTFNSKLTGYVDNNYLYYDMDSSDVGTITNADTIYGYSLNTTPESFALTVTNSELTRVIGGYASGTTAAGNLHDAVGITVNVSDSTIGSYVYGAWTTEASASNIEVVVTNSTVGTGSSSSTTGTVFGAYVGSGGSASDITVTIGDAEGTGGTTGFEDCTINAVTGAYVAGGNASGIEVTVNHSTINDYVYGAQASTAIADESHITVTLNNSSAGSVYGAWVQAGDASGIDVTINSSEVGAVRGSYATDGSASNSTVTINGSTVTRHVYGGYSKGNSDLTAEASGNSITITNESEVTGFIQGGLNEGGNASSNKVTIEDGSTVAGNIYGGRVIDTSGNASDNQVIITDSEITLTGSADSSGVTEPMISGGHSISGTVSGNSVSITNSTVVIDPNEDSGYIFGGASGVGGGDASGNSVTITDSTITSDISGGYAQVSGEASSNTVTVTAENGTTTVSGIIYGGESYSGKVSGNSVEITGATVDTVYGGANRSADEVSGNTVVIESSATVNRDILGGNSNGAGAVSGNEVTISDSTVGSDGSGSVIIGGNSESGAVSENSITIDNSTVTGSIFGGTSGGMDDEEAATGGDSTNNTITLNSGTVKGDVFAGHSGGTGVVTGNTVTLKEAEITSDYFAAGYSNGSGSVSGNTIDINGGTLSGGYTYAGYSSGGGTVSGNIINLNGGTVSGTLYAGYSTSGTVSGNTINLDGNSSEKIDGYDIDVQKAILFGRNADATAFDGNTLNITNFSGRIQNIGYFDNINIDLTGLDMANAVYGSGSIIVLTDSASSGTYLVNSDVNIYSSTVRNSLSVAFTSESGLSDEYTVVANESSSMNKTGATITERIIVVQDPDKYPNSIQYSEYTLDTDDDRTISYIIDPSTTGVYPPGSDNPVNTNDGKTVAGLAGIGNKLSMHYAQLDDLRKRLGEVRYGAQDGLWARYIYQRNSYDGVSSNVEAKQNLHALNLGLDHIVTQDEDSMWMLGGNFKLGHDNEKVRSAKGKGNMNSYGLNLYATYANQFGCYTDLVLSFDQYHQKIGAKQDDNSSTNGKFNTWGWGASIEVGKMFSTTQNDENWGPWHNHWWLEPQAQLSYYWIKGKDWSMNNGMTVSQHNGDSLVGRLGVVVGKQWSYGGADKVDKRYVQAYLKGGVKHEFLGSQKTKINKTTFDHKLRGTAGYYGAGVDWNLTKQVRAYAQVERDAGGRYKKDIEASIGLKWQF